MKTITTDSFKIAMELYQENLGNVISLDFKFVWRELGFRFVLKFKQMNMETFTLIPAIVQERIEKQIHKQVKTYVREQFRLMTAKLNK